MTEVTITYHSVPRLRMFHPSHLHLIELRPHLIAHTQPIYGFNSNDGLAGAAIRGGEFIVTSPNCEDILFPPLGERVMSLDYHLRFGEDDPLEWPQLYNPELPHLPCLPLPPRENNDLSIMWDAPKYFDFEQEPSVIIGINGLKHSKFRQLGPLIRMLCDECKTARFGNAIPLIPRLMSILDNFLYRVELNQGNHREMFLRIRETQRAFLELKACTDYLKVFKPTMDSWTVRSRFEIPARVRGAFTFNPIVCEKLYRARIPVWLIRPGAELESIRVMAGKTASLCTPPLSGIPPLFPPHPPIYVGPEYSSEKYRALESHVAARLQGLVHSYR